MKGLVVIAALLAAAAVPCRAQAVAAAPVVSPAAPSGDMTLGGVPQLLAQKIQEAKPAGIVDLAGHAGGGAYVPTWTLHDQAGHSYVEAADLGYRALQGAKPTGYVMPFALNVPALSARAWNFAWAQQHVTRSPYPDMFLGMGPLLPFDRAQLQQIKLKNPKDWLAFSASVRFN